MRTKTLLVFLIAVFFITAIGVAIENKGERTKELFGGDRGNVSFPHHLHQDKLGGCNACHSVFPRTHGSIGDMKKKGTLKPKEVMNKQCIKCHRAEKKAGRKSGPLTCSKCHVK
ncbi:MAG: cytochrome c3 family protein [Deltaproteobacteria bacterium]|nr:cytochrome c3 family protein [Deltaproteobacteria bacterium]MBW1815265.1 cytochrome c3 family protein [Deltaproteobacteria bacterium]MBW1848240.1 cytochrome c3 family protein [Deltaproteobacteria bacterium]MBW2364969.1 cytochrome c3 family protein [Deltaproteobacteria bacterium]